MGYIETGKGGMGNSIRLYYEEWGNGRPVVFIHGWPLSHEMWEYQLTELPNHGLRCIAYDRRGFGKSDKPWQSYDYDTLADDLKSVLEELNLRNVTLVGYSMGGGEVVRYFSKHGGERVSKVILVGSVAPYLLKTDDNPEGVDRQTFEEMEKKIKEDRPAFLSAFGKQFFGVNLVSHPASEDLLRWAQALALIGSPKATLECLWSFAETDFRNEVSSIRVPTLIIHGDSDNIVPIELTSKKVAETIPGAQYLVYEGAPHGLFYTEKERLNNDILEFVVENRENNPAILNPQSFQNSEI
ncbi:MAG TPA: alpha/beta hydrolase [Cytophagales bacterium]|nr:alpha/beta hydrolase [Cytophagales bacterium]